MNEGRRRRSAKQRRRDARRAGTGRRKNDNEDFLPQLVRKALAKHPLYLLSLAAYIVATVTLDRYAFPTSERKESLSLENVVINLAGRRCRETTALLAVLAELLVDDEVLRDRCREEVAARNDHLPKWIVGLPHVQVHRAVRRTHVLGDGDELAVGARLAGGTELTVAVYVDHNELSSAQTITVLDVPIAKVIADASRNIDPDTSYVDVSLADARAWIDQGLTKAGFLPHPDSWRKSLPLVKWLVAQLPEGGTGRQGPDLDDEVVSQLLPSFFAAPAGAPFRDAAYQDLLMTMFDSGSCDPLRWSAARIEWLLDGSCADEHIPLEIALDASALLRAFVPFAHAQSGVRSELTDLSLAAIDDLSLHHKRNLLKEAAFRYDDDDVEPPPWLTRPNRAS
jgi:hypothetical protein